MSQPRVPLFPIALLLSALFAILFEVFFPTPGSFADKLKQWQPLVAVTVATFVALFAAYVAYTNTTATLKQAQDLKRQERSRKHAAVRSVLPLALVQLTEYAERSAHALLDVLSHCDKKGLPRGTIPQDIVKPLPSETLKTLTDFIEYSDPPLDVGVLQSTISLIQIHGSRLRQLVKDNHDPSKVTVHVIPRTSIEARIIDAASIYAGAGAIYRYARQQDEQLPRSLSWDAVRNALGNMQIWNPNIQRSIAF
jgi:hypothetical protein